MTNKEKFIEVFGKLVDHDFTDTCAGINCPSNFSFSGHCSDCPAHNFWKNEYKDPNEISLGEIVKDNAGCCGVVIEKALGEISITLKNGEIVDNDDYFMLAIRPSDGLRIYKVTKEYIMENRTGEYVDVKPIKDILMMLAKMKEDE